MNPTWLINDCGMTHHLPRLWNDALGTVVCLICSDIFYYITPAATMIDLCRGRRPRHILMNLIWPRHTLMNITWLIYWQWYDIWLIRDCDMAQLMISDSKRSISDLLGVTWLLHMNTYTCVYMTLNMRDDCFIWSVIWHVIWNWLIVLSTLIVYESWLIEYLPRQR